MSKTDSAGNINLQVLMDGAGLIEVWIPSHILDESIDAATSASTMIIDIETYIDEEYNLPDMYYFTPNSVRTINNIFNKSNNLGDSNAS